MWDAVAPLYLDLQGQKVSCLALYQPAELQHKILPQLAKREGGNAACGDSGGNQLRHEQQASPD